MVQPGLRSLRTRELPWSSGVECFQRLVLRPLYWMGQGERFPRG